MGKPDHFILANIELSPDNIGSSGWKLEEQIKRSKEFEMERLERSK